MKIKVSEATGPALDYLVAKCEGWTWHTGVSSWFGNKPWLELSLGTQPWVSGQTFKAVKRLQLWELAYSTDWAQGGPIIEREEIDLCNYTSRRVSKLAALWLAVKGLHDHKQVGNTPLIAAMRCYVVSKLGEEVEVPDELATLK